MVDYTAVTRKQIMTEATPKQKFTAKAVSIVKFSPELFRVFMMTINDKNVRQVPLFACGQPALSLD